MKALVFLAALAVWPHSSWGQSLKLETGNDFFDDCRNYRDTNNYLTSGICLGYARGFYDQALFTSFVVESVHKSYGHKFCAPPHIQPETRFSNGQILDIIIEYLRSHPQKRSEILTLLANEAFSEAFPCPKNP